MKQQQITDATCKRAYLQLFLNLTEALGSVASSIFGRVVKVFDCKSQTRVDVWSGEGDDLVAK